MAGIGAIVGILGSVVGAIGSIAQGQAAQSAAKYNAAALKQQAESERQTANANTLDYRRQQQRRLMEAVATQGASGVTGAGSPLMVNEATVREIALGASRIGFEGRVKSNRLMNEAELEKMRGRAAMTAGYIGAGTSLLSGFGSMYGQGF